MDDNDLKILAGIKGHILSTEPLIFDIGANRGNYTDFVLSLFPNAKILLVEPNDIWINELSEKYAGNKNIKILNMLVGQKQTDLLFYYFTNSNDQLSSIYKRPVFDDLPMQTKFKTCTTIDAIMDQMLEFVDFIKVDTEGAEFDVIKGTVKSFCDQKIKFMQIEYGGTYPDAGITMKEIIRFVNALGYRIYSFNNFFSELNPETFIEDYHYDNYLISKIAL